MELLTTRSGLAEEGSRVELLIAFMSFVVKVNLLSSVAILQVLQGWLAMTTSKVLGFPFRAKKLGKPCLGLGSFWGRVWSCAYLV